MKVPVDELRAFVFEKLAGVFDPEVASEVTAYLLWAETSGISTQGLVKLTGSNAMQHLVVDGEPVVDHQSAGSVRFDARNTPAPFVSVLVSKSAVRLASSQGIGIAGYHNTQSSGGALAYYTDMAACDGYVAMMMARSPASVSAFGGIDAVFGTNPIAYSIPTMDDPISFDAATSAFTRFGVVLADRRGESLPEGVAIDRDGVVTTSPADALDGAILPYGGHKGSGLALLVEVLAGGLVGAGMGRRPGEWGAVLVAIDPGALGDADVFRRATSELVEEVRRSRAHEGEGPPRLPGERARRSRAECGRTGLVEVADDLLAEIGFLGTG
ncbi:MAG TPA: Ldh family oxidoreductase [Acidimicrobiales bacterium]|nr:Ldh family oxidoreductase [Acidimicrobiales bacterium]